MLDASAPRLSFDCAPDLPVAQMVLGKPAEEAAAFLPRIFNLCRAAQTLGVRHALDLPVDAALVDQARAEIRRDHVLKLAVRWPARFGMPALRLPPDWQTDTAGLARALFGPAGAPPPTAEALLAWIRSDTTLGPVLHRIDQCFPDGAGETGALPEVTPAALFVKAPLENSVAGRQAAHPAMIGLAARRGFGPLWRAAARLYDLAAALEDRLPAPACTCRGRAVVTAARGAYAVNGETRDGRVTRFARITPTDHLTAPGGILERALAALPADRTGMAPLLVDILDPCQPVTLKGGQHA